MNESEQRWAETIADIKCPLKNSSEPCRKSEGVAKEEDRISRTAVIYIAECNFCGEKASGWGDPS